MHSESQQSFIEIYEQHKRIVYTTVLSYLQSTEDAEEVTQDVFVEVHRSIQKFKGESTITTWIYRISINKSLDFLKAKNRKKRFAFITSLWHPESGKLQHDPGNFEHPGVLLENKEKSALLFAALYRLPEKQKTAFILSKVDGLGNIEISRIMEMSVGAVESLLSRAKENLRKELEKKSI
jgi:RNA polymerase sigma-70 factor (ECF subfamily)